MRVTALVTLDLENKKIVEINFHNIALNLGSGVGQIKAFIRRRVLNMPIQSFTPLSKKFYTISMEIDVYPLVKKCLHPDRPNVYKCKLSPLPLIGKESDITFEEYEHRVKTGQSKLK